MRVRTGLRPSGGRYPVGESPSQPFQLSFNASFKIDFQGSRVTSDGGLILVRELDERSRVWRIDPSASDGFTPWQEHAVSFRRLATAIGLQPPGGLRRPQRRGE